MNEFGFSCTYLAIHMIGWVMPEITQTQRIHSMFFGWLFSPLFWHITSTDLVMQMTTPHYWYLLIS